MKKSADTSNETLAKMVFRVFPQGEKVNLTLDSVNGKKTDIETRVEVPRPVSSESLDEAREVLAKKVLEELRETSGNERTSAQKEIDTLFSTNLILRAKQAVSSVLILLVQILFGMILVSLPYKGIQYSNEKFPEWLQIVVLTLCTILLCLGFWLIATERNRWKTSERIMEWFGPRGLIIFPGVLLMTAAAVFASFTFILFESGAVELQRQNAVPVSVAALIDFYMWHFLKLIPLLKINEVVKWAEPVIYSQSRVGFLILLFSGFCGHPYHFHSSLLLEKPICSERQKI